MRRGVILVVLVLVILAGLDLLLWRFEVAQLAAGWNAWAATTRTQGWTIESQKPVTGGWPLAATLEVPELFMAGDTADVAGGVTWSTDRVVLRLNLLHPRSVAITAEGMQRVRFGELPEIPYTADRLRVVVPLEPGVPVRSFSLRAVNLRAGLPTGGATVAAVDLHAEWTPAAQQNEPAIAMQLVASEIGLPPGPAWLLGSRVEMLQVEGALDGPLPRVPGVMARATAWRDGGGTLDVRRLAIRWGVLDATATATLALDDAMQPMGTGTAHIVGAAAALDGLSASHAIGDRAALAAKALLALMTHPAADGGAPEVEVPLTLQDRRVALGRIPLARLPPVVWPQ